MPCLPEALLNFLAITFKESAEATLAEMFPGRFWMGLGSGELLNEGVVGMEWPPLRIETDGAPSRAIIIQEKA